MHDFTDFAFFPLSIQSAAEMHGPQERKAAVGVHVPYINHPVSVATSLLDLLGTGTNEEERALTIRIFRAALFHDGAEDRQMTSSQLQGLFGDEEGLAIWQLVQACSEDKSLLWEDRHAEYLAEFQTIALAALPIRLADKANNLQGITRQLRLIMLLLPPQRKKAVQEFWGKFHASPDQELAFYRAVEQRAQQRLMRELAVPSSAVPMHAHLVRISMVLNKELEAEVLLAEQLMQRVTR